MLRVCRTTGSLYGLRSTSARPLTFHTINLTGIEYGASTEPNGRPSKPFIWPAVPPCLPLVMDGRSSPEVAQWLYRGEETIRTWVHGVNEDGLQGLE
jgi:hypothetical protein